MNKLNVVIVAVLVVFGSLLLMSAVSAIRRPHVATGLMGVLFEATAGVVLAALIMLGVDALLVKFLR